MIRVWTEEVKMQQLLLIAGDIKVGQFSCPFSRSDPMPMNLSRALWHASYPWHTCRGKCLDQLCASHFHYWLSKIGADGWLGAYHVLSQIIKSPSFSQSTLRMSFGRWQKFHTSSMRSRPCSSGNSSLGGLADDDAKAGSSTCIA